jgi:thiol:disulfide interchange protein
MKRYFFVLFMAVWLLPTGAWAAAGVWQGDPDVKVRLISGVDGTATGADIPLGLDIQLTEGWHTYWREPGPMGLPPRIDWKNSKNLQSAELLYPEPIKFGEPGFESLGYKGHVVLPIHGKLLEAGKPLALDASLELLLCNTICVPKHFTLKLDVPAGAAGAPVEGALIMDALAKVPVQERTYNWSRIIFEEPTNWPPPVTYSDSKPESGLWVFVLLAIMGGFILNLTPCVLPVLSLKLLSFVTFGGGSKKDVRRSFLMTAAGILFSFLIIALITVALKASGRAVGWGMQFQLPAFLVMLTVLLTLFASNLWDLYEIQLPRFLADRLNPVIHQKMAGDFVTGAFATLLATPCTVPFLGTAVGFALARGPLDILIIFMALGFGMITPYLAFAMNPRLVALLPCPGPWMAKMRHILGSVLLLTVVWFLTVLASQIFFPGVAIVAACMAGIVAVFYLKRRARVLLPVRAAVGGFIGLAFLTALTASAPASVTSTNVAWQKFDEKAMLDYLHEGKTVFVDVTADWCVNCKANEQITMARHDVTRCLFGSSDVVAMRADWTNPNPSIGDFLKRHGRYGVPFNAVFGPGAPDGFVLPELLTPGTVIDGLKKANEKTGTC